MMRLTCTNMPVEKIDHALTYIKSNGIQKVLDLRGGPPHVQDKFVQVEGGFACALDLVRPLLLIPPPPPASSSSKFTFTALI